MTASAPGFSSSVSSSLVATVTLPGLILTDGVSVGQNLQVSGQVYLGEPAPTGGITVTLNSSSSNLLLSASATVLGSTTTTVTIPGGGYEADFNIQALGSTGTFTYTASVPGYQVKTGAVTLTPSGIVISGPFGYGNALYGNVGVASQVYVSTAQLNPTDLSFVAVQALAPVVSSLSVSLNSSSLGIGTISPSVSITPTSYTAGIGAGTEIATFTGVASGTTIISVLQPGGYSLPSNYTTLTADVFN